MNKKPYEAPTVRKVRLVVKNSILGTCHTSPNMTPGPPEAPTPCSITVGCYTP
jgi:hypothetical protein